MNPIRVALVEDDPVVRNLLYDFLSRQPELHCVIKAESAEDFLQQLSLSLSPQVVLLDIGLPGISGILAVPLILQQLPEASIIIQTVFDDADFIYRTLCQGAMGYILKSSSPLAYKEAILDVVDGGTPFSRSVSRKVLAHFKPVPLQQSVALSPREQQVLEALVDGLTNKEIAARLQVGLESVRTYIKGVYTKLQVRSRPELLNRALRGTL